MASISASVELYDRMSAPLMSIMDAMNMTISSMRDMQRTMDSEMDTSSLDAATQAVNQANAMMVQLNNTMHNAQSPVIEPQIETPNIPNIDGIDVPVNPVIGDGPQMDTSPVPVDVEWNTPETQDIFTNTGIERFRMEVNQANVMMENLVATQANIGHQAASTNVFSANAIVDMSQLGNRLQAIQNRIREIEANPLDFGDSANNQLEQLRSQLIQAVQEQNQLNQAVQNMDVGEANAAYVNLQQTIGNTERFIRDNFQEQENFNNSINNGNNNANKLMNSIKGMVGAYLSIQAVANVVNLSDELVQTTARLNQMNDGLQTTDKLVKMVYMSAQNARGSFSDMANVVARFGNNAKDAFGSTQEVIQFANLIQKQMTIAGASTQEASNAMIQLSQGLGSGVLRGEELNSVFEQAPNIIQSIADYLNVPIGKIREMASEGQLTADVVKAAIFASADDINAKFGAMPMTWDQVWTTFQNSAIMAFQPVLNKINELANNKQFQGFVENAVGMLAKLAVFVLDFFNTLASIGAFISDNWSVIAPIVYGVIEALIAYAIISGIVAIANGAMALSSGIKAAADMMQAGATFTATAAQHGLNAALMACPLTWIILLIIALIAIIFAVASAIAKTTGVANSGFGVICGGINVVIQFFKNLGLTVANIALGIGNAIEALGSNMMTAFHNAICSIQSWFYGLLSTALSVIENICVALNKLPFVEFDYSGISSAANDYASKAAKAAGNKENYKSIGDAFNAGMSTFDTFQDGWAANAFNAGASWGDGVADKVSGMFSMDNIDLTGGVDTSMLSNDFANNAAPTAANTADTADSAGNIADSAGNIADSAGNIADSVDISKENLKYLRDIAETEAINRFTTAEIQVTMNNNNTVSNSMDIDGMVDYLSAGVLEAMEQAAEGVH